MKCASCVIWGAQAVASVHYMKLHTSGKVEEAQFTKLLLCLPVVVGFLWRS